MVAANLPTSPSPTMRAAEPATERATDSPPWTAARFFDLLQQLGRLRVISVCGPSVFESLCVAGPYDIADGFLNMVTDAFHWHVALPRLRHLQSYDSLHGRSGRNVLFFELREHADAAPFLRNYVYRAPGVEFAPEIARAFQSAHAELEHGAQLATGEC
jgi:hypothetical protein